MQTLKLIVGFVLGVLAIGSFLNLLAFVLFKTMRLTDTAPPAGVVLTSLAIALVCGSLCVALISSANKKQLPRDKRESEEKRKL